MTRLWLWLLRNAPVVLFVAVCATFGATIPHFATVDNLRNICVQAAPTGVVAVGMTFVLIAAGVDLSVGAIMFVAAAVAGKLALGGWPLPAVVLVAIAVGGLSGAANALVITRLRVAPFIVTLATLFIGRGFALGLTETRAMNLPDSYLSLGSTRYAGVPLPLAVFAGVVLVAHVALARTPSGRRLYAAGQDAQMAQRAGIHVSRLLFGVYVISGLCAGVAAVLLLGQLGAVTPKFGENYEFKAIAAAVLGGTSLFGGRGAVLPGTVIGTLLIQCIEDALVLRNIDPYLYPLVTSAVIFAAVLLDTTRSRVLQKLNRPRIRIE